MIIEHNTTKYTLIKKKCNAIKSNYQSCELFDEMQMICQIFNINAFLRPVHLFIHITNALGKHNTLNSLLVN